MQDKICLRISFHQESKGWLSDCSGFYFLIKINGVHYWKQVVHITKEDEYINTWICYFFSVINDIVLTSKHSIYFHISHSLVFFFYTSSLKTFHCPSKYISILWLSLWSVFHMVLYKYFSVRKKNFRFKLFINFRSASWKCDVLIEFLTLITPSRLKVLVAMLHLFDVYK